MHIHPLHPGAEQAERPTTGRFPLTTQSTIYARTGDLESARCESIALDSGWRFGLCGKPADYVHARRFLVGAGGLWLRYPICEQCAYNTRRVEVDQWLQSIGAQVVKFKTYVDFADMLTDDGAFFELDNLAALGEA